MSIASYVRGSYQIHTVIDGDKIGVTDWIGESCVVRLSGVKCLPSKGGVTTREVVAGKAAKRFTCAWIATRIGQVAVDMQTQGGENVGVVMDWLTRETLNEALVAAGHATVREEPWR